MRVGLIPSVGKACQAELANLLSLREEPKQGEDEEDAPCLISAGSKQKIHMRLIQSLRFF